MKAYRTALRSALAGALLLSTAPLAVQAQAPTVPIDVWALREVVTSVSVSPDGQHILVLKTESKEGDYVMEIYKSDDLSKPWRRLNADPMEIIGARWVNDNYIFGTAWEVVRKSVSRPEDDVRGYKSFSYSLADNKFSSSEGNLNVVNLLRDEPNHILVSSGRSVQSGDAVDPFEAFRPRAYYRYNLETGAKELLYKGNDKFPTAVFDNQGNPRFTSSVEPGSHLQKFYYRLPGEGSWTEYSTSYDLDSHDNLYRVLSGFQGLVGFKDEDPTVGYMLDTAEGDKAALWEFDFKTGKIGQKLFEAPNSDVIGIQTSSMSWAGDNHLTAALYPGEMLERHWFDPKEQALYDALSKQIPEAWQVWITSRSRDGNTMIVNNAGPKDPGSFWLVRNGRMSKLGSTNPLLRPEQLADVQFINYKARDGRTIPAYLTVPQGKGPFPLVVLPHGGPHVNEIVTYDEWSQFLANQGYMVLQPQYRISTGWGKSHFDAGYGEHGGKMQDDLDDGALALVTQGLVDRNRIAMFGWSYGGYAALASTTRDPQIYQCAIAGAAVADPEKVYNLRRNPYSPKALDEWEKRRGTIGINPIKEVAKSNIPLLMIHGDVDRRVLYFNYKDYEKAMEKAGKTNAQFVTLKGADHFYNTLMYNHQTQLFTTMRDFLAKDCGPGGL
ncbi:MULTISPECIES: alpha/beta hydrolase family protein [Qipengyuania]|uniref:S9 family peptidase n=1 Tax=Qipengyuania soli TaxID=2782568 RepID=A0A7S8F503_9SPHN|nr:prolyl oligopeptidase family serine peptidase [Qipengyuania soli]QPC99329.1 S9 family peptidase [Qipengyuania soli]